MKRNLLCYFPNATDATSFYRGMAPLSQIRRLSNVNMIVAPEVTTWATLAMADGIFLQRPSGRGHLNTVRFAKQMNIPIWIDYDDDIFAVPEWNPAFDQYGREDMQKMIAETLASANIVSVSTPALKKRFEGLCKDIVVIPNAFNDFFFTKLPEFKEQKKVIFWRGSKTHRRDLNLASEACIAIANENPDLTFQFLGDVPWFADYMPANQVVCTPPIDPIAYFDYLSFIKPQVVIVPLVDCEFNHAKSNIAWIEASYAGAATLAPNFDEWNRPGVTRYTSAEDFEAKLKELISLSNAGRLRRAKESWQYICSDLRLSSINRMRVDVIDRLLKDC